METNPMQTEPTRRDFLKTSLAAVRTRVPGTWGEEVVLGTGQVEWEGFFRALSEAGFTGNLCIEREGGTQRVADIRTAREYVEHLSL